VVPVVTHVVVRADDPAFDAPTKPIGPFLSAAEAADLASTRHWTVREDAGRGYRRVVASPEPVDVVELEGIRALAETGAIVIACGGGGIPVVRSNGRLVGVEAVIDKDHAAQLLATRLNVDALVLVTGVPAVQLDFGKPSCRELHELDVDEAEAYLAAAQFPPGSMAPKVLAATRFVRAHDRIAVITSPERMYDTLMGERHGGTRIVPHAMRIPA
jgi:carbamate kinase